MYESLPELFMTGCGLLQFAYWLGWAWLLIATDSEALDDILDRENERHRRARRQSHRGASGQRERAPGQQ